MLRPRARCRHQGESRHFHSSSTLAHPPQGLSTRVPSITQIPAMFVNQAANRCRPRTLHGSDLVALMIQKAIGACQRRI
jgi:hypothetical protein